MFDRNGVPLFSARYPQRVYHQFSEIPPQVANSLMFIEDRDLLDNADRGVIRRSNGTASCWPPGRASPA